MNELLTTTQVAAMLGVTPHTLVVWRMRGLYKLPWIRIGSRVRYARDAVERWMEQRTNTGEIK